MRRIGTKRNLWYNTRAIRFKNYCDVDFLTDTHTRAIMRCIRRLRMRDKSLLKLLCQSGWVIARIRGSHHILKRGEETLVLPIHGRDIPIGLLNAMLKQTRLK